MDDSVEALWESAPDKIGFETGSDGVKEWKTQDSWLRLNAAKLGICRWRAADCSRRSIHLRTKELTISSASCGQRGRIDLGESDNNVGQCREGQKNAVECCAARNTDWREICGQICVRR